MVSETTGIFSAPSNKCTLAVETILYIVLQLNNKRKGIMVDKIQLSTNSDLFKHNLNNNYILNINENSNTHINYSPGIASIVFPEFRIS